MEEFHGGKFNIIKYVKKQAMAIDEFHEKIKYKFEDFIIKLSGNNKKVKDMIHAWRKYKNNHKKMMRIINTSAIITLSMATALLLIITTIIALLFTILFVLVMIHLVVVRGKEGYNFNSFKNNILLPFRRLQQKFKGDGSNYTINPANPYDESDSEIPTEHENKSAYGAQNSTNVFADLTNTNELLIDSSNPSLVNKLGDLCASFIGILEKLFSNKKQYKENEGEEKTPLNYESNDDVSQDNTDVYGNTLSNSNESSFI